VTSDAPPPSPPLAAPTETPSLGDNAEFSGLDENMIKRLKVLAGVIVVGGAIGSIVGLEIKHLNSRDT
jgi:hypothetical protein